MKPPDWFHNERFKLGNDMKIDQRQPFVSLSSVEFSFIKWYYGLYPEQWRLISDVINFHPLTRGKLRSKEQIQELAPFSQDRKDFPVPPVPWRETHLPLLINGREGSLMNHIQFVNKCHLVSLQKV